MAIRALFTEEGIDVTLLRTVPERTGTALITVGHDGDNSIVVVAGANETLLRLTGEDADAIRGADVLVTQFEGPDAASPCSSRTGSRSWNSAAFPTSSLA